MHAIHEVVQSHNIHFASDLIPCSLQLRAQTVRTSDVAVVYVHPIRQHRTVAHAATQRQREESEAVHQCRVGAKATVQSLLIALHTLECNNLVTKRRQSEAEAADIRSNILCMGRDQTLPSCKFDLRSGQYLLEQSHIVDYNRHCDSSVRTKKVGSARPIAFACSSADSKELACSG